MEPLPPWRRRLALSCGVAALALSAVLLLTTLSPRIGGIMDGVDVLLLVITFVVGRRRRR